MNPLILQLYQEEENTNTTDTKYDDKILEEMKDNKLGTIINNVLNGNIFNKTIFNETYQISTLSNKNKLENLSFIDVQDCENLIRRSDDKINEQYDYLLYKIEYATNEFQVPIIEYKILSKLGIDIKEADISACKNIKFYYHIPFEMNTSEEYLYNPNTGEHFFTASVSEKNNLVSAGWKYEGIGWKAPATSNTPVYRLYNKNTGDHHYTTNVTECDNLVKAGWKNEGIGWYSDDNKSVPLYRQYNPNAATGSHNYTTSKAENDQLISLGWREEGIGWYGVK